MRITILDDEGAHHVFPNVSFDTGAAVMHALSGERAPHAEQTGACLCTSFSQTPHAVGTRRDNNELFYRCLDCGHDSHITRTHCGAMA